MSENKFTTIKERVIQIADYKEIAKEKFFGEIGMTSANFRGEARKTPLNSNAIENILSKHSDINPTWLLTGEGDMLLDFTKGITGGAYPATDKELNDVRDEAYLLNKLLYSNKEAKEIEDRFVGLRDKLFFFDEYTMEYELTNMMQSVLTCYTQKQVKLDDVKEEFQTYIAIQNELLLMIEPHVNEILQKISEFGEKYDKEFMIDK